MQERKFCDIKLFCGQPSTHVKNLNILSLILVITMFAVRQYSLLLLLIICSGFYSTSMYINVSDTVVWTSSVTK